MSFTYKDPTTKQILTKIPDQSSVTIPSSVTEIDSNATKSATNLRTLTFEQGSKLVKLNLYSFHNEYVEIVSLKECLKLTVLSQWCFRQCRKLKTIELPEKGCLTRFGQGVFADCISFTHIHIPSTVEWFDDCQFDYGAVFHACTALVSVIFCGNSKLKYTGEKMFWGCSSLTQIVFPKSLNLLGFRIFTRCSSLREIVCHSTHLSLRNDVFYELDQTQIFVHVTTHQIAEEFIEQGLPSKNIIYLPRYSCTRLISFPYLISTFIFFF